MASIFSLYGNIFIDNEKANKSIDETTKKGKNSSATFTEVFANITKKAMAIGTAVVGATTTVVGGITAMTSKFSENAKEIDYMAERIGWNTTKYQEWNYIAQQAGTTMDTLQGGITDLAEKMDDASTGSGEAAEIFQRLGLSVRDANGNLKDQNVMFEETIVALQQVEDATERQALATKLMSTTGEELLPIINSEVGCIDELKQEAYDLGVIMSEDSVNAGAKFKESLNKIKNAFSGIFNQLMSNLIPVLQTLLNLILDNMPIIQTMINNLAPILINTLQIILPIFMQLCETLLPIILDIIMQLLPPMMQIIEQLLPIFTNLLGIILPPLIQIIKQLLPAIIPIVQTLLPLITPLLEMLNWGIENILIPVINVLSSIANIISKVLVGALKGLSPVLDGVKKIFEKVFGSIFNVVKAPINFIIDGINAFIKALNKIKIPDWVPAVGGKGINIPLIKKLRVGIDNVPYDEMPALLHKGEAVLTAEEAKEYRKETKPLEDIKTTNYYNTINIDRVEVREDSDIKRIAEELYYLQQKREV